MAEKTEKFFHIIIILTVVSLLVLWNVSEGELTGPDTCQHAITGIFMSDFLKDFVFLKKYKEMWNYTWTYYAHYPAVALLPWIIHKKNLKKIRACAKML